MEKLTLDWQQTAEGSGFRICDWDVYDAQMRKLLGLIRTSGGETSRRSQSSDLRLITADSRGPAPALP